MIELNDEVMREAKKSLKEKGIKSEDEFDNFIVKQDNFNKRVHNHLLENSRAINKLQDIVERTSNDV
jgi:hypothetical protein